MNMRRLHTCSTDILDVIAKSKLVANSKLHSITKTIITETFKNIDYTNRKLNVLHVFIQSKNREPYICFVTNYLCIYMNKMHP